MIEINTMDSSNIRYRNDVPVLTRHHIEAITEEILGRAAPEALTRQAPVDVEFLIEDAFELRLDYQTLASDGSILGETIFRNDTREVFDWDCCQPRDIWVQRGTILLDETMCEIMETRTKFTAAHELGHWIMHQNFYSAAESRACRNHRNQQIYFSHHQARNPIEWTEWQANAFASALLLPRSALRNTLRDFLKSNNLTWNTLRDFSNYRNREKYVALLDTIARTYDVSRDTARLRMNKLCGIRFPY